MNHATETKKLNNQGFSLVELIIVVAIMAVLVGVLAPQYLQYVEKSRYQSDVTMVDEIKGAIEVAIATDEDIYASVVSSGETVTFSADAAPSFTNSSIQSAVLVVVPEAEEGCKLTSKTCKEGTVKIVVDTNGIVTMEVPDAPGAAPAE